MSPQEIATIRHRRAAPCHHLTLGRYRAAIRAAYLPLDSHQKEKHGPACRRALYALEDWQANQHPRDSDELAAASACCEAAENLRYNPSPFPEDHWPAGEALAKRLLRHAERLAPMLLAPVQMVYAGLKEDDQ